MMMLTSATASAAAGPITTTTLVLIAIGIVSAIAIIVWGAARRRAKAHEVAVSEEHAALAGHAPIKASEMAADGTDAAEASAGGDRPLAPPIAPPPAPERLPQGAMEAIGEGRPVSVLKGLGPKAATRLGELGITTVDQLAALSASEADAIDAQMGAFTGRMTRDRWIEQAKLLAAGDVKGFEAAFGKLGG